LVYSVRRSLFTSQIHYAGDIRQALPLSTMLLMLTCVNFIIGHYCAVTPHRLNTDVCICHINNLSLCSVSLAGFVFAKRLVIWWSQSDQSTSDQSPKACVPLWTSKTSIYLRRSDCCYL